MKRLQLVNVAHRSITPSHYSKNSPKATMRVLKLKRKPHALCQEHRFKAGLEGTFKVEPFSKKLTA